MAKLATPISHLFENDSARKSIVAVSDCLECRDSTLESQEARQFVFHCDLDIVHPWTDEEKSFLRAALWVKEELKLISFHMATSCTDPALEHGMYQPGGVEFTRAEMIRSTSGNISWLRACFGSRKIEIAVENNNYYPTGAYKYVTNADFIDEIVYSNNIRFLFDLAHARITAHNKGISYDRYVSDLPLVRMIQIHVSKHQVNKKGFAFDAHELPDETILRETRELEEKYTVEYVTFEYYKDQDNLVNLLKQYQKWHSLPAK